MVTSPAIAFATLKIASFVACIVWFLWRWGRRALAEMTIRVRAHLLLGANTVGGANDLVERPPGGNNVDFVGHRGCEVDASLTVAAAGANLTERGVLTTGVRRKVSQKAMDGLQARRWFTFWTKEVLDSTRWSGPDLPGAVELIASSGQRLMLACRSRSSSSNSKDWWSEVLFQVLHRRCL